VAGPFCNLRRLIDNFALKNYSTSFERCCNAKSSYKLVFRIN